MRKASRPTPPPGNHGPAAPTTPHGVGTSDPINEIIRSLNDAWKLGMPVRDLYWSPSTGPKSTADKIYNRIRFLYYRNRTTLDDRLNEFSRIAPKLSSEERLDLLLALLPAPTGTPKSSMRQAAIQSPRTVLAQSFFPSQLSGQVPRSPQLGDAQSNGQGSPSYATAQEDGSATDDDEDGYVMPPSPTTSSKAAQRRVQASPRVLFNSAGRKRLSDSSTDDVSPKLSKIFRGGRQSPIRQSAYSRPQGAKSNVLFKKPSIDALRSFQSASTKTSFTNSMNISFNTDSTPTSSQLSATQPFTANTSFASDTYDEDAGRPGMKRTSSTTIGYGLADEDSENVSAQINRETLAQLAREHLQSSDNIAPDHLHSSGNETRESISTTYDSVDEEALADIETSFRIESDMYGFGPSSSPTRRVSRSDSARSGTPPSSQALRSKTGVLPNRFDPIQHVPSTEASPARQVLQPRSPRAGTSITKPASVQAFALSNMQQHSLNESSPFNIVPPRPVGFATTVPRTLQPSLVNEPSPPKPIVKLSPSEAQAQSPSKMSHHIYRIPEQNLFVEAIPDELKNLPYFVLFICHRIATERKMSIIDLTRDLSQHWSDPDSFWHIITERCPQVGTQESKGLWSAQKRAFDGYTFKGQIEINKGKNDPVFKLKLLPIAKDLSCRFQRHFGADRFLFLNFPSFDPKKQPQPRRFTEEDMKRIEERWVEWFSREHSFLGRTWRAFHIEPVKKKNKISTGDTSNKRVILFATDGCGIKKPISIGELMNWFFPLALNKEQNFCKAYARLNLGLSRTTPTLVFKPSQVFYVQDIKADGSPEDKRYNDDSLWWDENYEEEVVMNDGCSLMSVGAAQEIWKCYKKTVDTSDPMPSVFQGRIGGAKGMWMVSAESYSRDPDHRSIWIKINESQKKFEPHPEDMSDNLPYDPDRLTFEICAYSSQPDTSDLHISFIPIMTDRGVPKETIEALVAKRLDQERTRLLEMLPNPLKLYNWVFKQSAIAQKHEEVRWQAALPHTLPDKIKLLLESGFDPTEAPYLAKCLHRFIKQEQLWMEQKLRIPLGKAAFLYGVADPLGVLAPGEVHVQFSRPFIDAMTDEDFRYLNDMDLLVARQPACRRSDIQRVRATTHPKLAHFVDTVVFSSRGQYPLAGKLQGGDYDGDIFWLCWEQALVEPFKNAPPPIQALNPLQYGIKKDTRQLHEVMNPDDLSTVDSLLKEVLAFRTSPSLLGIVTSFLEKQAYKENRIHSDKLNSLCDMHDLLVDAPKQAYTFTDQDWRNFVRYDLCCGNPSDPAYKIAMEACEKVKEMGEVDNLRTKEYNIKEDNIIDHLYFNVVRKHDVETLKMVTDSFPKVIDDDAALRYPYLAVQERKSPAMELELKNLRRQLKDVYWYWNRGMMNNPVDGNADNYNRTVEECYKIFRALMPTQPDDPEISSWLRPFLSQSFSMWETLRASVLYTSYPDKVPFVWHMAGRELAELKARSVPGSRLVCWPIHKVLRPKLLRIPRQFEGDASDDEDLVSADEDYAVDS